MHKNLPLTQLITSFYACRQDLSKTVLGEVPPNSQWKEMRRPTAKGMELKLFYDNVEKRIEGPKEDRDFTRRPKESTTMDPWGVSQRLNKPPTKEHS